MTIHQTLVNFFERDSAEKRAETMQALHERDQALVEDAARLLGSLGVNNSEVVATQPIEEGRRTGAFISVNGGGPKDIRRQSGERVAAVVQTPQIDIGPLAIVMKQIELDCDIDVDESSGLRALASIQGVRHHEERWKRKLFGGHHIEEVTASNAGLKYRFKRPTRKLIGGYDMEDVIPSNPVFERRFKLDLVGGVEGQEGTVPVQSLAIGGPLLDLTSGLRPELIADVVKDDFRSATARISAKLSVAEDLIDLIEKHGEGATVVHSTPKGDSVEPTLSARIAHVGQGNCLA